jgi:hypothetical protein
LISPSRIKLRYVAWLQFTKDTHKCTNNIAYEVIMLGLHKLRVIRVQRCVLRIDSKVVSVKLKKNA